MSLDYDFTNDSIIPSSGSLLITATGALYIPTGTTGERPVGPTAGYIRFNTTLNALEFYNSVAAAWQTSGNPETNGIANLTGTGLVVRTGTGTYTTRALTQPAAGITISNSDGVAGSPTFALANDLAAVEGLAVTGLATRTATDTWTARSLTQPAAGITISNSDGVSGNPTFALANDLAAVEGLATTGVTVRTATDTWTTRTITGTTNTITMTNGDGISGNPTITIANNPVLPGLGSVTLTIGATGDRPGSPVNGMIRYNTTLAKFEAYEAGAWVNMIGGGGGTIYGVGVRVASIANVTVASPGASIDGVALSAGDRVLLKNQTTTSENGTYLWNGAATPMTRTTDMDSWAEVPGVDIYVREGAINEGTSWWNSSVTTGTIGSTAMTWTGDFRTGRYFGGNEFTLTRANSGGFSLRPVVFIDSAANSKFWRFVSSASGNSSGFEFVVGNAEDCADPLNYWWDMSVNSEGEEGVRIARRTGGTIVSKLFVSSTGALSIGDPANNAPNPSWATQNGLNFYINGTSGARISSGTTAQRPVSPINGTIRYNTTTSRFEGYQDGEWVAFAPEGTGVRVASTANINLAAPGATIDGISMVAGDRVLVKNQSTPSQNGLYVWNGAATPMIRSALMQSWQQVPGRIVMVTEGTTNANAFYWNNSAFTGTIDVTPMTWTGDLRIGGQFNAGNSWTAARAASGSGPRVIGLIDTNAAVRIWRFNTGATDPSIEFGYGTNDDLANAANSWWDTLLDGSQDSYTVRRRTGNVLEEKLWVAPNGNLAISNDWNLTAPAVGLVVDHTDAVQVASGTTAQRPTGANGYIRYNTSYESFEIYQDGRWEPIQGSRGGNVMFDDFLTDAAGQPVSSLGWESLSTGTGTGISDSTSGIDSTDRALGVVQLTTGTTTTGRYGIELGQSSILFGYAAFYMEWRVEVPILSTVGDEFDIDVGFCDQIGASADTTDGAWFEYDRNNSTQWVCATANNNVRTRVASGTTVTAATWYRLGIEVNAAGTLVTYYINGTQVATINTNIPTGASRWTGIGLKIEKSAGANARTVLCDFFKLNYVYTTPR